MSYAHRSPSLLVGLTLLVGCDEHGISLGHEQACREEPRLIAPTLFDAEPLAPCTTIGASVLPNGGFEAPGVADDCPGSTFCNFPATEVPGWQTSSAARIIEVWSDGHRGVPSAVGAQFGELDAASPDTLWQDFMLPPEQLMYWSLLHRGRIGVEELELTLGPPDAPARRVRLSSDTEAWYEYSGLYRVGTDESVTRLALISLSGVTEGNLVDEVTFAPVRER